MIKMTQLSIKMIVRLQSFMRRTLAKRAIKDFVEVRDTYRMNSRYFTREEQFETLSKTKSLKDTGPEALIQKSYTYRNGAVYTGQWLGNFRNGRGRMEWPDSASYEGSWEWGYASGRGVFIDSVGNKYEGDFKNSMAHGRGTYTNTMGAVYEGEWRFDMQHGRGIERWTNSNSYFEGEFKDGLRCGHGVWTHD